MHSKALAAVRDRVSILVPSWNPEHIRTVEPLRRGLSNQNFAFSYSGREYVLRIGRPGFAANPAESEAWSVLADQLPAVVAANWHAGDLLTQRIRAPCLAKVSRSPDELILYLTELHRVLPSMFCSDYQLDRFLNEKAENLRGLGRLPSSIKHRLDHLSSIKFIKEACHNDLNAWNILVSDRTPSSWITLDWEWAGNFSRLFDALNLALFYGLGADQAQEVAKGCGYLDESRYGPFEVMLERYWLREYCFAATEAAQGRDSEFIQEQLHTCLSALSDLN